ncbi:MAG: 30S ribosomal protein S2 [Oligoflexia bacterium]|nr:30S ribosomal protein S2 [Oligoflexia bacterium]
MSQVTMKEMLEAGVHFGHQVARWNPRMKPYVFGARSGIYIIDLQKTVAMAQKASEFAKKVAAEGGRMIFVGTKKQARETIQEAAKKCGQYYMTERWLGGTLTNFETIKQGIDRLRKLDQMKEKGEFELYSKKEAISLEKERLKLLASFEGIRDMKELPSALFVVDLKKEHIAIEEARKLGIAVIGLADTNSDPGLIEYPIPSNDDAIRAIKLFANMVAESYNQGAAIWEQKLRAMSDKQADVAREMAKEKAAASIQKTQAQAATQEGGPTIAVVKRTKKRALVTAGRADENFDDIETPASEEASTTEEEATDKE